MKNTIHIILLSLIFFAPAKAIERPSNEIPMYGGEDKSHIEPNVEFSKNLSERGWKYLMRGDVDTAIKRFNQAWMFNNNNVEALWGFGIVSLHRADILQEDISHNLSEAVRYLEMAKSIEPQEVRLIVDLSLAYIAQGDQSKKNNEQFIQSFNKAENNLKNAIRINDEFPDIYANYSLLKYLQEDYAQSKRYHEKAKSLGFQGDPDYERKLHEKLQ